MLDFDPTRAPAVPRDAATVLLLRPSDGGFEVFMVRRNADVRFMGGAYVFPGGKLDEADRSETWRVQSKHLTTKDAGTRMNESDDAERAFALHVAACRETLEEAGVLLARNVDARAAKDARDALTAGQSFADVVKAQNVALDLSMLVPLSRWITPTAESRRFDARFFLAQFPEAQEASHDDGETVAAAWLTPVDALVREERGEIQLPPPTIATLQWLAKFSSMQAAIDAARAQNPPRIDPEFVKDLDDWVLAMPGDRAHPRQERVMEGATRFELRDGRWVARDVSQR